MRSHKPSMNWLLPLSALIGIFVVAGLLVGYIAATSDQRIGAMGLPSKESLNPALPERIPAIRPGKSGLDSDAPAPVTQPSAYFVTQS